MTDKQYNNLKKITQKICNNDLRAEDLLHDVILKFSENIKYQSLDESQKVFYFVKTIKNQFYSNNSVFQKENKRYQFEDMSTTIEKEDEVYCEKPTMDWVNETMNLKLSNEPDYWYEYGIWELYIKHKTLVKLHQTTRIPKYSLRETLNNIKEMLKTKWIEYERNNYNR
jgi:hypothetical protein